MVGGGGVEVGHFYGIQRLWSPPRDGDLHLIPGEGDFSSGQQLSVRSTEFSKGECGVEEYGRDPQQGGARAVGVQIFI